MLFESGEMYLETILVLSKDRERVRSIDIVESLQYSKPSVSKAMSRLKAEGYVNVSPSGSITLTENGLAIAEKIYERHQILTKILIHLGVQEEIAASDACKIEHDISDETFEALKKYVHTFS